MIALAAFLISCGTEAGNGIATSEPAASVELKCEDPVSIERALAPDAEGHTTPAQAADAWRREVSDIPDGTWREHGSGTVLLVSEGETVGSAEVGEISGNSVTTFPATRYVSTSITYCSEGD